MKLENQVVNKELSKKIKKLGVKQTAHWDWVKDSENESYKLVIIGNVGHKGFTNYICAGRDNKIGEMYSAFTVAELFIILPSYCRVEKVDDIYIVTERGLKTHTQYEKDKNCANAMALMLIYLIKNGLITLNN